MQFDQNQYDMLKRCSDKKDLSEWNEWRKKNPSTNIHLSKANFEGFFLKEVNFIRANVYKPGEEINYTGEIHLEEANFKSTNLERAWFGFAILKKSVFWHANASYVDFNRADLEEADLSVTNLKGCDFSDAILKNANIVSSHLEGAKFTLAKLMGCRVRASIVDEATMFWEIGVNKFSKKHRFTDFSGTSIGARIGPGTRLLLEYNIRRMNWEAWYEEHPVLKWLSRAFWWISDYGLSTWRIIGAFFFFVFSYALLYWAWPDLLSVKGETGAIRGFVHTLYFSVVTMTVGFSDTAANVDSRVAQALVMLQVILGYILLGALVTRFAILFTSGGPAGKFKPLGKD